MHALLSCVIWLPIAAGVLILLLGDRNIVIGRWLALAASLATLALTVPLWMHFDTTTAALQFPEKLAWIPHFLQQMDYTYTDRPARGDWHRYRDPAARPSDFFHSNVFCSFQEDAIGIRERDIIGVHTLMWGSDYPHTETTFPRSREITSDILRGVPEAEQEMILYSNAKRLYGFEV